MRHACHPWILAAALLTLVTGCEQPGARSAFAPTMRIGVVGPDAAQPIIQVNPSAVAGAFSSLTVTVRADSLLARRVLATVADVESVVVKVLAADGTEFTATVTKAQLSAGTVSVTFPAVPVGFATVTMVAYDAANQVIGSTAKSVKVVAGTVTPVDVPLTLHRSPPGTSSGGSGASPAPSTGGVSVNGTLSDGPSWPAGVLAWFDVPLFLSDLKVDATGRPWAAGTDMATNAGVINGYDTDGQVAKQVTLGAEIVGFGFDGADAMYAMRGIMEQNSVVRFTMSDLTATPVQVLVQNDGYFNVETGPGGEVWAGYHLVTKLPQVVKFYAFQHVFDHSLGDYWNNNTVDGDGNLWITDVADLVRVSAVDASHTKVTTNLDRHYAAATDAQGDVWVAGRIGDLPVPGDLDAPAAGPTTGMVYVAHFKPDGTFVDRVVVGNKAPYGLYVDPTGTIYMSLPNHDQVVKYSPTGTLLKTYAVPAPFDLRFGGGKLWVSASGPNNSVHGFAQLEL